MALAAKRLQPLILGGMRLGQQRPATPPGGKSFLQNLFEEFDLPGSAIRNLLTGNISGAARNVGDIATLASGLRLIPGLRKKIQLTRDKKDRPTFGMLGDILTDPLTWLTFGGAGAAAKLGKMATKGVAKGLGKEGAKAAARAASKTGLAQALTSLLTKAGRKGVEKAGKAAVPGFLARISKTTGKTVARKSAQKFAKRFGPEFLERLGQRKALKGMVVTAKEALKTGAKPGLAAGIAKGLVKPGGIGLGIPFREPAISLLPGVDILAKTGPGLLLTKTRFGRKMIEGVQSIFRPLARAGPRAERIAFRYKNDFSQVGPKAKKVIDRLFSGWDETMRKDWATAYQGLDPRGGGIDTLAKVYAKYGDDATKVAALKNATKEWPEVAAAMLKRDKGLGILKGSRIKDYLPLQMTEEQAASIAQAALEGGDATPVYRQAAASVKSRFLKPRKHTPLSFMEKGLTQELDAQKLVYRRVAAHELGVANARLRRAASTQLGATKKRITDIARLKAGVGVGGTQQAKLLEGYKFRFPKVKGDDLVVRAGAKGKTVADLTLSKIDDVTYEVSALTGQRRAQAGVILKAQETLAAQGKTLKFPEWMTLPQSPKIGKLTDDVLSKWIRVGKAGQLEKRKAPWSWLAKYNQKLFKPLVTVGLGPLLNVKFITRNLLSGIFQAATDEDMMLAGFKHFRPMADQIISKIAKVVGLKYHGGRVHRLLKGATEGIRVGKYSGDEFMGLVRQHGGIQRGFATELGEALPRTATGPTGRAFEAISGGLRKGVEKLGIKPQLANRVMEYSENAMRLNGMIDLVEKGIDIEEAAKKVTAAFLDYRGYGSKAERAIRDVIPFAKFTIEQTPRTLAAVARRPVMTQPWRAMSRAGRENIQGPLPQWLEGQPLIGLGEGERGPRVLHQFGTPLEDLDRLATGQGVGRTLEQSVVGAAAPPLKWLYMAASGRDPFTGREVTRQVKGPSVLGKLPPALQKLIGAEQITTPSGYKFTKVPWQVAAVLRDQPLTVQFRAFDTMMDQNQSLISKSINLITGMRVIELDTEYELKRRIRDYLTKKVQQGEVGEFARFFATGDTSPELTELIKQFYKAGAKRKPRR